METTSQPGRDLMQVGQCMTDRKRGLLLATPSKWVPLFVVARLILDDEPDGNVEVGVWRWVSLFGS